MNKMLPIGLFSTLFLTACGGSDGGSSAPATKTYTWQFVEMNTHTLQDMKSLCNGQIPTLFHVDNTALEEESWKYTYAVKAPDVLDILVYEADGSLYKNGASFLKNKIDPISGVLTFSANEIPEGGYITVVDKGDGRPSLLTVQKNLLSNALVKINANQGRQACYTANSLSTNYKKVGIIPSDNAVQLTSVESYLNGQSEKGTSVKSNIKTAQNEYVLLSGFDHDNQIIEYKFEASSKLSADNSNSLNSFELEPVPPQDDVVVYPSLAPNLTFSSLDSFVHYKGQVFNWNSWVEQSHYGSKATLDYGYSAKYKGILADNWNVTGNAKANSNGEITLELDLLDMPNHAPRFDCGSTCVVNINNLTNLDVDMIKIEYQENATSHVIYTTDKEMNIPLIPNGVVETSDPTDATPVQVSMLMGMGNTAIASNTRLGFMSYLDMSAPPRAGFVDLLIAPGLGMKHQLSISQTNHIIIDSIPTSVQ